MANFSSVVICRQRLVTYLAGGGAVSPLHRGAAARFSKVPKRFRTLEVVAKSQTLRLHSSFICRLLHGKCARTVFTRELLAYQKANEWVFWYKNNEWVNTEQSTYHAVIFVNFCTYWDFSTPTRFSPFTRQNKYQVMFLFRPSVSTSLLQILV